MRSPQSPGSSTYLDHIEGSPGGRYAEAQRREMLAKPTLIGTSPTAQYPKLPFNPFENDQAPEPTIDASDCGAAYNIPLGEPHEIAQAAPPPPQVAGEDGPTQMAPETGSIPQGRSQTEVLDRRF